MKDADIEKIAFNTQCVHYEYFVIHFGLTNAPAKLQMLRNTVLAPYRRKFTPSVLR